MSKIEMINLEKKDAKIEVDIWSDIVCPFCYIGKRNFENALKEKGLEGKVNVRWRSFELAPDAVTKPDGDVYKDLAARKGWSIENTKQMHKQVTQRAAEAGLTYNFDIAVPANSRNAHRLLHLAAKHNVQNEVKESLFKAYFTEGKNIDDEQVLTAIGREAGLAEADIKETLHKQLYESEIDADIREASGIGVQGVPFFVFNRKYGVSGAQPVQAFAEAVEKVADEMGITADEANSAFCSTDGECS